MPARELPIVVFDVGNVLLRWDRRFLFRQLFDDEKAMEEFLATACSMTWILELDRGMTFEEGVRRRVALFPHYEPQLRAFDERWLETLGGPIEENVSILERLRAEGRPIYAITNFSHEKFDVARAHFPFLDAFDGAIVSGREGLVKPDRAIFDLFLARYRLRAEDTVFIDDSAANIEAARSVGMQAIRYAEGVDLGEELRAVGALA